MKVPRVLSDITPCWLTAALCAGRADGANVGPSVAGYSAETIAEGKGFMSQLFRLRLEYDTSPGDLPSTVIAKLPPDTTTDPLLRTVFDGLGQNQREVRFYRELAGGSLLRTPRSYHCGLDPETGDTVLLLEDLSSLRQGDSVAGCTVEEARRCVAQLARFHASWWETGRETGRDTRRETGWKTGWDEGPLDTGFRRYDGAGGMTGLDRLDWLPTRTTEAVISNFKMSQNL